MTTKAKQPIEAAGAATAPAVKPQRSLAEQLKDRSVTPAAWHTLANSLYPGARVESILLVIDYCRARNLDPLKKPVHIVPMKVKDAATGDESWRDVVLPGIYEQRITAHRTGQYLGHTEPKYGEAVEVFGVEAPAWCSMTMRRAVAATSVDGSQIVARTIAEFPVRVYFAEVVGTSRGSGGKTYVNARWSRAPIQMMTKCAEAAGLREAFPEELGGQIVAEEADASESEPISSPALPQAAVAHADVAELNQDLGLDDVEAAIQEAEAIAATAPPEDQTEKPL